MRYWVIVERYENYLVDRTQNFRIFGIPQSKLNLATKMLAEDKIITCVSSGKSCFSDIREVTSNDVEALGIRGNYDTAFPYAISTRPICVLPEQKWIPLRDVLDDLSFLYYGNWRQTFRTSLREIPERDAKYLISLILDRFQDAAEH